MVIKVGNLVHIRSVHLKENLGSFQQRGPGATPKYWSFNIDCVTAAAKSQKAISPSSNHSSFKSHDNHENPDHIQQNSSNFTFSNEVVIKKENGKVNKKYKVDPFKSTSVDENRSFILNTVGNVIDFSLVFALF